jgi:hypothetical protein
MFAIALNLHSRFSRNYRGVNMSHSKGERSKKFHVTPSRQNCKINQTAEDFIFFTVDGSAIYLNSFLTISSILKVKYDLSYFLQNSLQPMKSITCDSVLFNIV